MRRTMFTIAGVALGAAVLLAGGCARSLMDPTVVTDYQPLDDAGELAYWGEVQRRSAITNDEGLHGVLVLADGADGSGSYEQRVAALKERGWLSDGFNEPANMAMRRGVLAKAIAHAIALDGGVMMALTDKAPRYATKELVYVGIMPDGTENQVIAGLEFVGVISRAQDFVLLRQSAAQAKTEAPGAGEPGQ